MNLSKVLFGNERSKREAVAARTFEYAHFSLGLPDAIEHSELSKAIEAVAIFEPLEGLTTIAHGASARQAAPDFVAIEQSIWAELDERGIDGAEISDEVWDDIVAEVEETVRLRLERQSGL